VPSENAEVEEFATGKWIVATSVPIQTLPARCLNLCEHQVRSSRSPIIFGCPHQEGVDTTANVSGLRVWQDVIGLQANGCIKFSGGQDVRLGLQPVSRPESLRSPTAA